MGKLDYLYHLILILSFIVLIVYIDSTNSQPSSLRKMIEESRTKRAVSMDRRIDCDYFCRKTGFSGAIGGCQCGFTLFSVKRGGKGLEQSINPDNEEEKIQILDKLMDSIEGKRDLRRAWKI